MVQVGMSNKFDIKMNLPTDAELTRMFDMAPKLEKYRVVDQAVQAASAPVVKRARELAPRSAVTGSAKKRSKSQRDKADWNYPLWKTIKRVIRKYSNRYGLAIVGPEWPKGNKAYFNTSPNGRREVLWGKPTGRVVQAIRNFIVQAFDETKPEQLDAMKKSLQKTTDQVMRG